MELLGCVCFSYVARQLEEPDGAESARGAIRLVLVGGVEDDLLVGIENEARPRRERGSRHGHVDRSADVA